MPFVPTKYPVANPDVRIFFEGLLILVPNEGGCDVRVFNPKVHGSEPHYLSIQVIIAGTDPVELVYSFSGELQDSLKFVIDTPDGVKAYFPDSPDEESFEWTLDFHKFHSAEINEDVLSPHAIKLSEAVLYSARLNKYPLSLRRKGDDACKGDKIATTLGADIDRKGRKLTLEWGAGLKILAKTNTSFM